MSRIMLTGTLITGTLITITAGCTTPRTVQPGDEVGREMIGVTGGTLTSDDGSLVINVPKGALEASVEISVVRLADDELPAGSVPGTGFELRPDGIAFRKPVELTLRYDAEALPQADTSWLRVVQVLDDGRLGATQFVTHEASEGWVRGRLTHFSKYALADLQIADAVIKNYKKKVSKLDVLFVIDNSGSMGEEQANLAKNFPVFVEKLDKAGTDYRIGVISTDLGAGSYALPSCEQQGGDAGKLQNLPRLSGCAGPKQGWIDGAGASMQQVAQQFSCIAQLGTGGCGFEQPLEAARQALDPSVNPGFVRSDAALAIIFITDEDDCSAAKVELYDPSQVYLNDPLGPLSSFRCFNFGVTCDKNGTLPGPRGDCKPVDDPDGYLHPIQRYLDQLDKLKPNKDVVVAAIAGNMTPVTVGTDGGGGNPALEASCVSSAGQAVPPIRLAAFVEAFGARGSMHSICDGDFGPALDKVATLAVNSTQLSWCLPYDPIDTNPLTPQIEGDCVVIGDQLGKLAPCSAGQATACYALVESPSCGQSKTMIELNNITTEELGDELYAICMAP